MKISFASNQAVSSDWPEGGTPSNSHWQIVLNQGTTEGGSSGAPLFNQNHKIVGQNHGGNSSCPSVSKWYGRFDVSWEGGGTSSTRLKDWLDPDNTGAMSVDATAPTAYLLNKTLTGTRQFAALNTMHIEGNVKMSHLPLPFPICPIDLNPFTTEPGSNITFKGQSITIHPGTTFKAGSTVTVIATPNPVVCPNLTLGDSFFCSSIIRSQTVDSIDFYINDVTSIDNGNNLIYANKSLLYNNESIINQVSQKEFTLSPNPNSGTFQLETNFPLTEITNLKITNLLGIPVYETKTQSSNTIQLQNAAAGLYFVVVMLKDGTLLTQKMMIQ
jgi:hypothetical protein